MNYISRHWIAIKGLVVTFLILLLLVPAFVIHSLVRERQSRQAEAFQEISDSWAYGQTVTGPVVTIPYNDYFTETSGETRKVKKYIHILPDRLDIRGGIKPEKRYRGIYETVVYVSDLEIKGHFPDLHPLLPSIPTENILFNEAFLSVGITDLRGIENNASIELDQYEYAFSSGVETSDIVRSGISTRIRIDSEDTLRDKNDFSMKLTLRGSQFIYFAPVGKETTLHMESSWDTPSFGGAYLPDTREISSSGFSADWKVLHLNRNYPQQWLNAAYTVEGSSFGVTLYLPVDQYTKTDRSLKYAILIIALTFLIFFFLELLNNKSIHPLQYILIGFALSIFYTLLLSISEHLTFNMAYLISCIMTIGLITWYSRNILRDKKLAYLIAGNLVILYGFIFVILQLEDYALLIGSLGLFVILAIVMFFSRKIDWKGIRDQ